MGWSRRRGSPGSAGGSQDRAAGHGFWPGRRSPRADRFVLEDVPQRSVAPPDPERVLRRVAAEAVILQDQAEGLLREIRVERSLGRVAPRAGPLVRRFFALQEMLPVAGCGPAEARLADELAAILSHHAMALSVAMDFLAYEWRSPLIAGHLDALSDLGAPGRRLDQICSQLTGRPPTQQPAGAGPR